MTESLKSPSALYWGHSQRNEGEIQRRGKWSGAGVEWGREGVVQEEKTDLHGGREREGEEGE